jgi:hypothetical protein
MGCMEHGRKKYSKFVSKIPIFTYITLVHIDSTSNHSKSCRGLFLYILYNFDVKRTLFTEARKIIPRWWFLPKKSIIDLSSPIKMASTIRLVWKFASILRSNRAFKIAMKLDGRRRSLFDLPDLINKASIDWVQSLADKNPRISDLNLKEQKFLPLNQ